MAASPPSLSRVYDLLQELRQGIRRVEVLEVVGTRRDGDDNVWTTNDIEAFNISSIRTVSVCREALTDARYEAEQRQGDAGGAAMVTKVEQAERDLEHVRSELRRAVTARKRHEERNYNARTRAALLGTGDSGGTRRRALQPGDRGDAPGAAAGEAREMKQSLQRTRKMMAEQLARVAQVSEVMGAQDALLKDTFAEHQGIGGSLRRAGTTLTRLKAAEVMDTVVMMASTAFFFATVCFIVYQRLPLLGLL